MDNLLLRAKSGDILAVEELMHQYSNLLYKASAQHHLRTIQEEAYEEALLCFYLAIRDFDESLGVPFAGFVKVRVYQGVHNLFRKYVRIWQHEVALVANDDDDESPADRVFIDDADIDGSVSLKLDMQEALKKMPQVQYQVFCMIVIEGFSQKQVAQSLQVSQQMVSKNYRKAMDFLNQAIAIKEE